MDDLKRRMKSAGKRTLLTTTLFLVAYTGTVSTFSPQLSFVSTARAATKLGDLSKFKKIVVDTESLIDRGDLKAAKARIKDLETTWDEAEAGIKPRAASDWHILDKAIDRSLSLLRADTPKQEECKKALLDLRTQFEKMETK